MSVIAVAGLPGSGKSRLMDELQQQGYTPYDDIKHDWSGNLPKARTEAQQGKNVAVSDKIFCDEVWRRKLENELGLRVQWIFFENNFWQCAKNCLYRFMFEKRYRALQNDIQMICALVSRYRPYGDIRPVVRADENIPQTCAASKDGGSPNVILLKRTTMNQLRSIVKSLLPWRIRRFFRTAHRNFVFWRAMKRFLKDPEACIDIGNPVVIDLIYGWGNDAWSAMDEYLAGCMEHALILPGPTLECGSGLSTVLVGAIAKKRGHRHWALEHRPEWAMKVQRYLNRYKIDSVVLCAKPLKDYGDFFWYDAPLESMPDSFSLVVCDGPPGSIKGGRFGLVPIMRGRLKPGCCILLDDADREQELAIAKRWEAELGASFETLGRTKPYIKMMVIG